MAIRGVVAVWWAAAASSRPIPRYRGRRIGGDIQVVARMGGCHGEADRCPPTCGRSVTSDVKICPEMSKSLAQCPSCGASLAPDARYCRSCGASTDGSSEPPPQANDRRHPLVGPIVPWVLVGALAAAFVVVLVAVVVRSAPGVPDRSATPETVASATDTSTDPDSALAEGVAMSTASLFIAGIRDSLAGGDGSQADAVSSPQARTDLTAVFAQLGTGAEVVGTPACQAGPSPDDVECEVQTDRGPIVLAIRLTPTSPTGALVVGLQVG